ncbi:MAG: hypothetical protein BMS9Abin10_0236 [Gammaproteobacteria bacterium]|nr:MAG: hypothetical protein BMS9Abin10_0236 [Gammaproteobacteria bacterium]
MEQPADMCRGELRSGTGAKRIKRKVRWVRQAKAKVRGSVALPNAQARKGLGRCPSEAGKAKRSKAFFNILLVR